jgi:hypothetical protein
VRGSSQPAGLPQEAPFDLGLAVLLTGFSFEAYNTPPQSAVMVTTEDAAGCCTAFLAPQGRSAARRK